MAVIDVSVCFALINADEEDHIPARTWFRQAVSSPGVIHAPGILLAEVASALSRGAEDISLAQRVIAKLAHSQIIQLQPVTLALAEHAVMIAADHRVRGCDAVYLALAVELEEKLVTLDRQLLERGSAVVHTMQP